MGLVSLLERALPDLRLAATHFHVASSAGGGAVSFVSRAQGTFSGELSMGDLVVPGSGALVRRVGGIKGREGKGRERSICSLVWSVVLFWGAH